MQLMMYIGNDLIEAVPVDVQFISVPGYLGNFKRQLKQKYHSLLQESALKAEFLVVNLNPTTSTAISSSDYTTTAPVSRIYCQ
jgi:hypothetical protein